MSNRLLNMAAGGVAAANFLRLAAATTNGETFTIGDIVFEIQTAGATVTTGRTAVNLTASGTAAAASKVLTFATNVDDGDTVSINGQVYLFQTALTAPTTANEVLIGVDLTASRNNLVAAINGAAGGGTTYGSATVANTAGTAAATSTDAITFTAAIKGTAGNAVVLAEASTHVSWAGGAVLLSGGVDPTAAESITAAVAAINSVSSGLTAVAATGGVYLYNSRGLTTPIACTETLAGTNNAFAAAVTFGGRTGGEDETLIYSFSPTALEVTLGVTRIPFNSVPRAFVVNVRASTGIVKAWAGTAILSGSILVLTNNASVDWAATDTINVIAQR